ncbi:type I polyketide synthase [Methylovulum psychrotolerans]|uniref:Uncharacterized protein n=1 Tax=Methylovulum psychrotolerans TaxID=1704499 RepID=A0A1Z4BVL5_9GAMM|nr:type I polyketide synthase [Methylovulum psychrotolerans]ASF45354.1 hypothetical protein CEK71_04325 [Methylovulum psychrotolerans]
MNNRVALIAYSVRFPGTDTRRFWGDLLANKDMVTHVDALRWAQERFLHPDKRHPGSSYSFAAGSLGDISGFDAAFFGISPREAAFMDPQQRLLLELAWETLENAGIAPASLRGSQCGVYIGISNVDYSYRMADDLAAIEASAATGMIPSIASNRISYVFDLHGPSISMDTACSSSLVAFHQACQAIRSGEISEALAGGINLHLHPYAFITFSKATMLSKTGRCHVFDASGDGYVRSEGGGLFFLKNYEQALADGDPILALVAGNGVNTDGHKSGLTIPNPHAQAALMGSVYAQAGIDPNHIDYFEAHGTGTAVGDPIETHAIGLALGQKRRKPLLIGSVKSNLGHLESASGVAGLAKALNCLHHRAVPATIGIKSVNPNIKLADWNLKIVTAPRSLKSQGGLTIGVNSFGFGGANAHVILQTPPTRRLKKARTPVPPAQTVPLLLTAKDPTALQELATALADFAAGHPGLALYDLAYNTFFQRERHAHGLVVFSATADDAAIQLKQFAAQTTPPDKTQPTTLRAYTGPHLPQAQGLAFVYSGNGCQWQNMGKQLLAQSATFRRTVAQVDALFQTYADFSLADELAGRNGKGRYQRTEIAQPALFALQVGVTEVLREHGCEPMAVIGHSVGEVAAAWACGALSLAAAVQVIFYRSHHQGRTQGSGGMTAVGMNAEAMRQWLTANGLDEVYLAGINSHRGVTLAGAVGQLARMESLLSAAQIFFKRLDLDYAFHSPAMDPIEAGVREDLAGLTVNRPILPFYSSVTGKCLLDEKLDGAYWWHNIREPVQFASATNALLAAGCNTFVEIGAHPVLQAYLNDGLKNGNYTGLVIPTLTRNNDTFAQLLQSTAQLMLSGAAFDHKRWFPVAGQHLLLPNYPWQRETLWHPITAESHGLLYQSTLHPLLGHALKQHALIWENQLDTQLQAFLADHNVGGAVVFPGAGFAELALAAAHLSHATDFIDIEELEIRAPLLLSHDHSKVIRLALTADGSFTIQSRDHNKPSEWLQHSLGRVLSDPTGQHLQVPMPSLPERAADFDGASHAQLTRAVGLDYGPTFQAIAEGWLDGDSAIARLTPAAALSVGLGAYYLHPALLDNAFQLIFQVLKDELHQHRDIAFVPVKMGRLHVRSTKATPLWAHARLLHRGAHSLKAEFTLFDAQGEAVAVLKDVRFRAIRLHKAHTQALQYLDYHLTAAPLGTAEPLAVAFTLANGQLSPAYQTAALRYSTEVEPLLDSLCQQFIAETLNAMADGQGLLSPVWLAAHHQSHPETAPLLAALLAVAADQQLILATADGGWELNREAGQLEVPASAIWHTLVQDYPDYFYLTHLAGRAGMHLRSLLDGTRQASQLGIEAALYTAINQHVFAHTSKGPVASEFVQQYQQLISNLPAGQRLKVLEISAHSPAFAPLLCPQWDFNQADYTVASIGDTAFTATRHLCESYPLLHSLRWSETAEDNRQALAKPANFAIVHLNAGQTEITQQVLGQLSALLVPGSPVWIIGLQPARWIDAVLGLASDWWLGNAETGYLSPQLSAEMVSKQLETLGFGATDCFELMPDCYSGTYILTTHTALAKPADTTQNRQTWLLLADTQEPEYSRAQALAIALRNLGQQVAIAAPQQDGFAAVLAQAYTHIVHLAGFGQTQASYQTQRCWLASDIVRACENTAANTTVWLLTSQVAGLFACDQAITDITADSIAHDAALWGFGRCLMNESSQYRIQLVDLNGDSPALLTALTKELLYPDDEQEIVLTAQGGRFATRLRSWDKLTAGRSTPKATADATAPTVRLGFKLPGQLRNLHWQTVPTRTLAADEIEIEVKATGLNFRDVMYTLGLLSDEAVENGFVGPTLGLEFAGRVSRIGAGVSTYQPGDRVVGMGPACFSNRVVTQANAITLIPDGIGYAAAATIPSTFFTVYYALHHQARLQAGEKVLIHGAAGGVGIAAIQIAQWLGAEVYATVGTEEKCDFLRLLGIKHIYDSRSLRFAEDILAQTGGHGVDVVLNSLAGEAINRNFQVLKPFGRFLELGKRDFYENTHIGLRPFRNNISYFGIDADQLMQVRPELTQRLFAEMMGLFHDGILHPLPYTTFDANQVVDAFRYMQQAKQIGKIVVTYEQGIPDKTDPIQADTVPPVHFSADNCYFVTGGLGGFGLRSAQWLVAHGAKHLILVSRSGPASPEAQAALAEFAAQGVAVHAAAVDVTDKAAVAGLLAQCRTTMPPLAGIIHAAAVIEDGFAKNLNAEQLHKVMAPKIDGALHLHELTATLPLDFFVLYSSVTTLFGNPGQSHYVAANSWLEALAVHRRQRGLAATCIAWGAIDDVGFLARNPKIKEALQNRLGGPALASELALAQLGQLLQNDSGTLGIMAYDWHHLSSFLPSAPSPKFRELALQAPGKEHHDDSAADLKRLVEELPDEALKTLFADMLKEELAQILLISKDKIDANHSMYDMGLDSLMGVELMIAIEARFKVQIPVMALSEASSINKLAERLIAHLRGDTDVAANGDGLQAQIHSVAQQHDSALTAEQLVQLTNDIETNGTSRILT